jgi:hypothetical protein
LFLERFYATCVGPKQCCSGVVGAFLGVSIVFLSCLPQALMYNAKAIDYERVYCGYVTATSMENSHSSGQMIVLWDFSITALDVLLLFYNKHQIKQHKQ